MSAFGGKADIGSSRDFAQRDLVGQIPGRHTGIIQPRFNVWNERMKSVIFNVRLSVARLALFAACALTLVACQTNGTGPIAAEGPETRAARECWMRTEKTSARENLDKRADVVNKCIDEKMKASRPASPKT